MSGPGSSVGIATDYGLDGPGSNPGGDEIFRPSRPALGPTQSPVKCWPLQCRGHGRVELYLYPPSGPYRVCNGSLYLYMLYEAGHNSQCACNKRGAVSFISCTEYPEHPFSPSSSNRLPWQHSICPCICSPSLRYPGENANHVRHLQHHGQVDRKPSANGGNAFWATRCMQPGFS